MKFKAIFFSVVPNGSKKLCHISNSQRAFAKKELSVRLRMFAKWKYEKGVTITLGVEWMMTVKTNRTVETRAILIWKVVARQCSIWILTKSQMKIYICTLSPMCVRCHECRYSSTIFIQHEKKTAFNFYNSKCVDEKKKNKMQSVCRCSLQCGHGYDIFRLLWSLCLFSHCDAAIDKMLTW